MIENGMVLAGAYGNWGCGDEEDEEWWNGIWGRDEDYDEDDWYDDAVSEDTAIVR